MFFQVSCTVHALRQDLLGKRLGKYYKNESLKTSTYVYLTSLYLQTCMLHQNFIVISSQVHVSHVEGIIDFKLFSSFNYLF